VPRLWEEVIWMWVAATTMETASVAAVCAAEASA
jgi:hypothetical protein